MGKKILNMAPCRALYFLLCFSTFPFPSNNQPASKFAVDIKWANDNSTVRWSLHNLKVFQPLSKSKQMIQVLLVQSVTLPVTAGSEELLKQLLESHVIVYSSSAVTLQCLPRVTSHKKGNITFSWLYGQWENVKAGNQSRKTCRQVAESVWSL